MLIVVSARTEYLHDWPTPASVTELRLEPLPAESAHALADVLLGPGPDLGALKQRLVAHTEGNPFFLEESVQTLVETHTLVGEPGNYRLAKPVSSVQIPDRVQAVLAARIDRLPPIGKTFLQAGAAIGLTPLGTMRHIVLPQAFRITLPPLANYAIGLIKDTAVASAVAAPEILFRARSLTTETYETPLIYALVAALYFCLTFPVARLADHLERRRRGWA